MNEPKLRLTYCACLAETFFYKKKLLVQDTGQERDDLTICFDAISASLVAVRSSYCDKGLCSSSPATPPSSAPVYQSRSRRTCSSSHSLESRPNALSSPSGLVSRATRGVWASQDLLPTLPHPPPSLLELRGVDSHPTFGTRTLPPRSERGVSSQLRRSYPRSRFKRR